MNLRFVWFHAEDGFLVAGALVYEHKDHRVTTSCVDKDKAGVLRQYRQAFSSPSKAWPPYFERFTVLGLIAAEEARIKQGAAS